MSSFLAFITNARWTLGVEKFNKFMKKPMIKTEFISKELSF
jgi:hypothetical protein